MRDHRVLELTVWRVPWKKEEPCKTSMEFPRVPSGPAEGRALKGVAFKLKSDGTVTREESACGNGLQSSSFVLPSLPCTPEHVPSCQTETVLMKQ